MSSPLCWISGAGLRGSSVVLASTVVLVLTVAATRSAQGQTKGPWKSHHYKVLYSFKGGSDGAYPTGNLLQDAAGNLYGAASLGGPPHCYGTVFKLNTAGKKTILHCFRGSPVDGAVPNGGLIRDAAGNLYGTTYTGGGGSDSCGIVFKLAEDGKETVLHRFDKLDGCSPFAGLVRDTKGNLYGTTYIGGLYNDGTVFKLDAAGALTVLHSFNWGVDGDMPEAGLLLDGSGNLYGTTEFLAGYAGDVFKLSRTGVFTVLHAFTSPPEDGRYPAAGLIRDAKGNLYGTTQAGGSGGDNGTVFQIDQHGVETLLYGFGGSDGEVPQAALIRDRKGNFYGTTLEGGLNRCGAYYGCGTVFKLDGSGKEEVLHKFTYVDGSQPDGGLIRDREGNLYGTATDGGPFGHGVVFKITP
jgi:uncharacterized repeat protein (TIGR03803 family)